MNPSLPSRGAWPFALALLTLLACVKRPVDYEREYARTLAPKQQQASKPGAAPQPRRVVRVRLHAEARYRTQVLHWERAFQEQLRRATANVQGDLGVVFELEEARPWTLAADPSDMEAALRELEALDPGQDVDLVVGLLPALQAFTSSHHALGRARLFGRHAVVRGMENPDEHQRILAVLRHLPAAEQDALYRERKLHKETAVLLHEWAHTLGVLHESDSHYTMHGEYHVRQAGFSPASLQLLSTALRHLPQARREREAQRAWARELQEVLRTTKYEAWAEADKAETLAWTERVLEGREALDPEPEQPLTLQDRKRFDDVVKAERAGRLEVALQMLEPLVRGYPRNSEVQVMGCYLATRVAPAQPTTRERCAATAAAHPRDPSSSLNLAHLLLRASKAAEAEEHLLEARRRLLAHPPAQPGLWLVLAEGLRAASCVTWAEEAAARAKDAPGAADVTAWGQRMRRWMGLRAAAGAAPVAPEQEGAFVRRVRVLEAQLQEQALAPARSGIAKLGRDFPKASVVQVLQCELSLRSGQMGPARAACRRALAADDELVQAHYLLGWMADMTGARAEARRHLERVVVLEPPHTEAWQLLARQYQAAGMAAELASLKARYREEFARELR